MLDELQFTQARKEFTAMYNHVFNEYRPMIVKRKQAEEIMVLRTDLQKMLLCKFSLKPEITTEEDGSITMTLDQLDIYTNAESLEEATKQLIEDLKIYAQDYIKRSQLFFNAPNRQSHFPYVLRILLSENDDEIRNMLEL
ncbi:exoribonuclease R [Thermincola ferriacetica]|nr:exoribonuclease R [Thermincola ferriacetica]